MLNDKGAEQDKQQLVTDILELGSKLAVKYDSEDDQEFAWMQRNCEDPTLLPLLDRISVTMLHVLEAVGQLEPVNGITISRAFRISKGGVSKITRRLISLGLIEKTTRPDNQKEVYFHLTPLGMKLFELHRRLHERMNVGLLDFLTRYDAADLKVIERLLSDLLEQPRLVLDPKVLADSLS